MKSGAVEGWGAVGYHRELVVDRAEVRMAAERGYVVEGRARPLGGYPHMRRAGGLLFLSGTSARQPDDSIPGVERLEDGTVRRDIRVQTDALIRNLEKLLEAAGASLADLVEITTFLVDMADFPGYNEVYNRAFDPATGPARTTVAVRALPHPDLVIEMRAVAVAPGAPTGQ